MTLDPEKVGFEIIKLLDRQNGLIKQLVKSVDRLSNGLQFDWKPDLRGDDQDDFTITNDQGIENGLIRVGGDVFITEARESQDGGDGIHYSRYPTTEGGYLIVRTLKDGEITAITNMQYEDKDGKRVDVTMDENGNMFMEKP